MLESKEAVPKATNKLLERKCPFLCLAGAAGTADAGKTDKEAKVRPGRRRGGDGKSGLVQSVLEGGLEGLRHRAREALALGWDRAMEAQEGLFTKSRREKDARDRGKTGGEALTLATNESSAKDSSCLHPEYGGPFGHLHFLPLLVPVILSS